MKVHEEECSCETCNPSDELDRLLFAALEDSGYMKGITVEASIEELLPQVEE